jgi:hypothetical protein
MVLAVRAWPSDQRQNDGAFNLPPGLDSQAFKTARSRDECKHNTPQSRETLRKRTSTGRDNLSQAVKAV